MEYIRTTWEQSPSTQTPITAARLNNIELGLVNAAKEINTNASSIETINIKMAKKYLTAVNSTGKVIQTSTGSMSGWGVGNDYFSLNTAGIGYVTKSAGWYLIILGLNFDTAISSDSVKYLSLSTYLNETENVKWREACFLKGNTTGSVYTTNFINLSEGEILVPKFSSSVEHTCSNAYMRVISL